MNRGDVIRELERIIQSLQVSEEEFPDTTRDEYPYYSSHHFHDLLHRILNGIESLQTEKAADRITTSQLMIASGTTDGPKTLKSWMQDAEELVICDPYFFAWTKQNSVYRTEALYISELTKLIPAKCKQIDVFHLPGPKKTIHSEFISYYRKKEKRVATFSTTQVHDRIWIKNKRNGIVVGTSFGGLGNKTSFILELPTTDLENFRRQLFAIRKPA